MIYEKIKKTKIFNDYKNLSRLIKNSYKNNDSLDDLFAEINKSGFWKIPVPKHLAGYDLGWADWLSALLGLLEVFPNEQLIIRIANHSAALLYFVSTNKSELFLHQTLFNQAIGNASFNKNLCNITFNDIQCEVDKLKNKELYDKILNFKRMILSVGITSVLTNNYSSEDLQKTTYKRVNNQLISLDFIENSKIVEHTLERLTPCTYHAA